MNRLSSLLGGLAVIAIAVVFIVNFQPGGGQNQAKAGPDCAAEVLGNCVKSTQFWATYRLMAGRLDSNQADQLDMKKKAMDAMVERELLLAEAERLGVSVSDEEVTRELSSGRVRFSLPVDIPLEYSRFIPMNPLIVGGGVENYSELYLDRKTKTFSAEAYKRTVTERTRLSEEEFREFQRQEIIVERMRALAMTRVHVAESEAYDSFAEDYATAKVKFVRLHPAFYVDRGVDRADEAVAAWGEKNKTDVEKAFGERKKELAGECREVSVIKLELRQGADEKKLEAIKAKLEAAKKRIEDGAGFADVAREISEDRRSRRDGGRMGCVLASELKGEQKPVADALFAQKEPGLLKDFVTTKDGAYLIRLDKIEQGDAAETALKSRVTRELYYLAEAKRLTSEGAKEIQAAVKGGKSLEDAVKDHLAKYPEPTKVKTSGDKPKDGDKPKGDKPKGDKKDADKSDKKDADKGDKKDEPSLDDADTSEDDTYLPKVETSTSFTAKEDVIDDAAQGETPAAVAFGLSKPGEVAERLIGLDNGGFAVMVLVEKSEPSADDWAKEREKYTAAKRSRKQYDALGEYVRRLRAAHEADIKKNPEFTKPKDAAKPGSSSQPAPPPEE